MGLIVLDEFRRVAADPAGDASKKADEDRRDYKQSRRINSVQDPRQGFIDAKLVCRNHRLSLFVSDKPHRRFQAHQESHSPLDEPERDISRRTDFLPQNFFW